MMSIRTFRIISAQIYEKAETLARASAFFICFVVLLYEVDTTTDKACECLAAQHAVLQQGQVD